MSKFKLLDKIAKDKGKSLRKATGKGEPYTRPEVEEEEITKKLDEKPSPIFGYKENKKMVDEANKAQEILDARKKAAEELKRKRNEPSFLDKMKNYFKKKDVEVDPKKIIKNISKGKK